MPPPHAVFCAVSESGPYRSAWVAEDDPYLVDDAVIYEWDGVAAVRQVLPVEFGGRNSTADCVRVLNGDLVR